MDESTGKYLYCIVKEKKPQNFHFLGQEGKAVYTVHFGDLAMVVSDTVKEEYHFIKEYLTGHQKVIEEVMRKGYDVLPISFGTVAPSIEYVKEKLLKAKVKELIETFPLIEERIELGLKVFWKDMPGIFQEIVKENKEIQIAKKEAEKNSSQFKIAKVGELVQKALEIKRQKEIIKILTPLKKLAVDFKEREHIRQREILKDSMILSSAFLVPKENEDEFDRRVESFIRKYERRMRFIYVGPIPPFNFVELHLKI